MAKSALIGTDLGRAEEALRRGQLVGIPTETVYGLAANALNPVAVAGIFAAKHRPSFDPLIVHLSGADQLERYAANVPSAARKLAEACWPGPLTMVLPRRDIIPELVTSGLDTVALRVPRHPLTRKLLAKLDFPLAAPSANPFGYLSPTRPEHVADQLGEEVAYILDGGPCEVGLESTIISFADPDKTEMLRAGGFTREELEEVLGHTLRLRTHSSSNPRAPGMLAQHYSPTTPLRIAEPGKDIDAETLRLIARMGNKARIAYISFIPVTKSPSWVTDVYFWAERGDLRQAAARLFALLRTLDQSGYDLIVAESVPDHGLGPAINDRLSRAAARS